MLSLLFYCFVKLSVSVIIWSWWGGVCYVLTDVPVDNCKLVLAPFSVASPLELTSVGTAAPQRRGQVTFSLRVLNSRFCLFMVF